jgi:PKHD-type hydroxylase
VVAARERDSVFVSVVLPRKVCPPLFERLGRGMGFGVHVDNAVRRSSSGSVRNRTEVSATSFVGGPEDDEGGEPIIEDTRGCHGVELPVGDRVVYPADGSHRGAPVTRKERSASFLWIRSFVRDKTKRALLFDLDPSIMRHTRDMPRYQTLVSLAATYPNLLRQ